MILGAAGVLITSSPRSPQPASRAHATSSGPHPAPVNFEEPDINNALASGQVLGTPTLFINGVAHRGGYDAATLLKALAPGT